MRVRRDFGEEGRKLVSTRSSAMVHKVIGPGGQRHIRYAYEIIARTAWFELNPVHRLVMQPDNISPMPLRFRCFITYIHNGIWPFAYGNRCPGLKSLGKRGRIMLALASEGASMVMIRPCRPHRGPRLR